MPRASFSIGESRVSPGSRATVHLPVADLVTGDQLSIPVHVIHGRRDGPVFFVTAAVHGDEIIGVEVVRRLLRQKVLNRLRGTLIAVPVVNVYAFLHRSRYLPDRRDLNRSFPGSEGGSLASRLADLVMREVVRRSDFGLDIHSGSHYRTNLPQIRLDPEADDLEPLARAFGAPVILQSSLREGSLRAAAAAEGVPALVYEAGEVFRFAPAGVRTGVLGAVAVMRRIGMLAAGRGRRTERRPYIAAGSAWVRSPASGLLHADTPLGQRVEKGDPLALVTDPLGEREVPVIAPAPGIIVGRVTSPLVDEGAGLFHIGRFDDPGKVESSLADYRADEVEEDRLAW